MTSLYDFLENSGASYISLLERVIEGDSAGSNQTALFNETRIGSQPIVTEDLNILAPEEQEA